MQGLIYNHFHNILKLFDVLPNFSPQVKRCGIITYKRDQTTSVFSTPGESGVLLTQEKTDLGS